MGKLEQFKKLEGFKSAVSFVTAAKDASGGFHDTPGENATLTTTYYAVQVLAEAEQTEDVRKALDGTAK